MNNEIQHANKQIAFFEAASSKLQLAIRLNQYEFSYAKTFDTFQKALDRLETHSKEAIKDFREKVSMKVSNFSDFSQKNKLLLKSTGNIDRFAEAFRDLNDKIVNLVKNRDINLDIDKISKVPNVSELGALKLKLSNVEMIEIDGHMQEISWTKEYNDVIREIEPTFMQTQHNIQRLEPTAIEPKSDYELQSIKIFTALNWQQAESAYYPTVERLNGQLNEDKFRENLQDLRSRIDYAYQTTRDLLTARGLDEVPMPTTVQHDVVVPNPLPEQISADQRDKLLEQWRKLTRA